MLKITNCEHEGNQDAIVLSTYIDKDTGLYCISQFDREDIAITQEQALRLAVDILKVSHRIVTTDKYYKQ